MVSEPTNIAPRLILALLACSLINGALGGFIDWARASRNVPPDASLASLVAWRAVSAMIAAAACGAVAFPFVRPLTKDSAGWAFPLIIFPPLHTFHREGFLYELAFFAILMGSLIGVLHRINLDFERRRGRSSFDRRERC
jgi:hypothetical protein